MVHITLILYGPHYINAIHMVTSKETDSRAALVWHSGNKYFSKPIYVAKFAIGWQ